MPCGASSPISLIQPLPNERRIGFWETREREGLKGKYLGKGEFASHLVRARCRLRRDVREKYLRRWPLAVTFTCSSIAPFRDCLRDLVWGETSCRVAGRGWGLRSSDLFSLLFAERIPRGRIAWREESFARALHRRSDQSKRSVGKRCVLIACWNGETGTAAARVRLAFEFAETLSRAATHFPDCISYEKKLIELGDLKIFRLWVVIHLYHREALRKSLRKGAFCFEICVSLIRAPREQSVAERSVAENAESCREYYMGKVVASPESGPWWVKWVQGCPWLVPTPKECRMSSNQLVVGFGCKTE